MISAHELTALHDLGWFAEPGSLSAEHRAVWVVLAADGILGEDGFAILLPDEDLPFDELVPAAERVGVPEHAAVLARFCALAATIEDPDEPDAAALAALEELDAAWRALPSVDEPVGRFVEAHRDAFPALPDKAERKAARRAANRGD